MDCNLPGSSVHEFSRQEYWSRLTFPSPADLPNPGIEPSSPALADSFPLSHQESPIPHGDSFLIIVPAHIFLKINLIASLLFSKFLRISFSSNALWSGPNSMSCHIQITLGSRCSKHISCLCNFYPGTLHFICYLLCP